MIAEYGSSGDVLTVTSSAFPPYTATKQFGSAVSASIWSTQTAGHLTCTELLMLWFRLRNGLTRMLGS